METKARENPEKNSPASSVEKSGAARRTDPPQKPEPPRALVRVEVLDEIERKHREKLGAQASRELETLRDKANELTQLGITHKPAGLNGHSKSWLDIAALTPAKRRSIERLHRGRHLQRVAEHYTAEKDLIRRQAREWIYARGKRARQGYIWAVAAARENGMRVTEITALTGRGQKSTYDALAQFEAEGLELYEDRPTTRPATKEDTAGSRPGDPARCGVCQETIKEGEMIEMHISDMHASCARKGIEG